MVFIPHIVGFGALGVGRDQRYFYLSNRDAAMSSFYLNSHLPWGCGFVGIYRWIGFEFARTIQDDFPENQPLTRELCMDYSGIHVLVRHGVFPRSLQGYYPDSASIVPYPQ